MVFYIRKYLFTHSSPPLTKSYFFLKASSQLNFCPDFYRFRSVCHWRLLPNVILIACNSFWQCKTRPFSGKRLNLLRFQDDGVKPDPLGLLAGVCVCVFISSMVMQQPSWITIFAQFIFNVLFSFCVRLVWPLPRRWSCCLVEENVVRRRWKILK